MSVFSDRMKKKRLEKNVSQRELASKMAWHKNTIQRYEDGTNEPTISKAIEIAKALETSLDYLTGLSDNEEIEG